MQLSITWYLPPGARVADIPAFLDERLHCAHNFYILACFTFVFSFGPFCFCGDVAELCGTLLGKPCSRRMVHVQHELAQWYRVLAYVVWVWPQLTPHMQIIWQMWSLVLPTFWEECLHVFPSHFLHDVVPLGHVAESVAPAFGDPFGNRSSLHTSRSGHPLQALQPCLVCEDFGTEIQKD